MNTITNNRKFQVVVNNRRRGGVVHRNRRRRGRIGIIKENDKYLVALNYDGIGFINKSNNNSTEFSISLNTNKIIMNNEPSFNARVEFDTLVDTYLEKGACDEFFDYCLELDRLDLIYDIKVYIQGIKISLCTRNFFNIEFMDDSSNYNSLYFDRPVSYIDIKNSVTHTPLQYFKTSPIFKSREESFRQLEIITINNLDFIADGFGEIDFLNYYVSKEPEDRQRESLFNIPDAMNLKVTKANLLGKKVYITGLDGNVPVLRYE